MSLAWSYLAVDRFGDATGCLALGRLGFQMLGTRSPWFSDAWHSQPQISLSELIVIIRASCSQGCIIWGALGAPLPKNFKENQALAGNIGAWNRSTGNLRMTESGNILGKE